MFHCTIVLYQIGLKMLCNCTIESDDLGKNVAQKANFQYIIVQPVSKFEWRIYFGAAQLV